MVKVGEKGKGVGYEYSRQGLQVTDCNITEKGLSWEYNAGLISTGYTQYGRYEFFLKKLAGKVRGRHICFKITYLQNSGYKM